MNFKGKNLAQLKKWIKALRSGKFSQGHHSLEDEFNGGNFCCLGVACKVLIPKKKQEFDSEESLRLVGDMPTEQKNAPAWLKKIDADFGKITGVQLNELNDTHDFTFKQIANLLELVYIKKTKPKFDEGDVKFFYECKY